MEGRAEVLTMPTEVARRILKLFEECATTPREEKLVLDIVRDDVLNRLYGLKCASDQRRTPQHE